MDKEIKENIIKCSRCGLCMDVCPVYKAKRTETSVSRGKFLQLLGIINKDLTFDKDIEYNLDLCLGCKKCKKACPSDIDAVKIFAKVKEEYNTPFKNFINSYPFFKLKIFALKIFYKLKYPMGRNAKRKKQTIPKEKIAYFNGCVEKAVSMPLRLPVAAKKEKFKCCGIPFYTKGRMDLYEKLKNQNINIIKKYDKVVFNCATCYDTVLNYENLPEAEKKKLIYFTDFYKEKTLFSPKKIKVTFHKPCHLSDEKFFEIEKILSNIENIEYVRMPNYAECCGFGGDFFTRHIKTASILSFEKINNVLKTNADIVLTDCPSCLWSLKYSIKAMKLKNLRKNNLKAFDFAYFLNNFIEIKD